MTAKQQAFLTAMLEHSTVLKAAEVAGISRQTAYKYLNDEAFKAELAQRRGQCVGEAVQYLKGKLSKCSEELIKIIDDSEVSPQVRINAINAAFAAYKSLGEVAEVQERLERLERLMEEGDA